MEPVMEACMEPIMEGSMKPAMEAAFMPEMAKPSPKKKNPPAKKAGAGSPRDLPNSIGRGTE